MDSQLEMAVLVSRTLTEKDGSIRLASRALRQAAKSDPDLNDKLLAYAVTQLVTAMQAEREAKARAIEADRLKKLTEAQRKAEWLASPAGQSTIKGTMRSSERMNRRSDLLSGIPLTRAEKTTTT